MTSDESGDCIKVHSLNYLFV